MRKTLLFTLALVLSAAASRVPAFAAAIQYDCNYCATHLSAFCDIRTFHTSCSSYYANLCGE
jgi:hypothetical protein